MSKAVAGEISTFALTKKPTDNDTTNRVSIISLNPGL